jgi:hypothetical protein
LLAPALPSWAELPANSSSSDIFLKSFRSSPRDRGREPAAFGLPYRGSDVQIVCWSGVGRRPSGRDGNWQRALSGSRSPKQVRRSDTAPQRLPGWSNRAAYSPEYNHQCTQESMRILLLTGLILLMNSWVWLQTVLCNHRAKGDRTALQFTAEILTTICEVYSSGAKINKKDASSLTMFDHSPEGSVNF